MTEAQAAGRFSRVNDGLATEHGSVSVGLAQLEADDALDELVARADEAMYEERQRQRSAGA